MIAFIADLHLQRERPETTAQAINFLNWAGKNCSQVFILGDLFEYWLGDDCPLPGLEPFHFALCELSKGGCAVSLMHGNRDFLLGETYCNSVGAKLIREDTLKIQLGQQSALLLHGDTLCTDDTTYQQARVQLRDAQWQNSFTALSFEARQQQAQALRQKSKEDGAQKTENIMDANPEAADKLATSAQVDWIIHGHTHRPFWHTTNTTERVVVGDWHANGAHVALYNNNQLRLKHWPFDS